MTSARMFALCTLLGWWTMTSGAQSTDEEPEPTSAQVEAEEEEDEDIEPVISDDVFKPSERIEADSEISYPSDI